MVENIPANSLSLLGKYSLFLVFYAYVVQWKGCVHEGEACLARGKVCVHKGEACVARGGVCVHKG